MATCCLAFVAALGLDLLKRGKEFFLMLFWMGTFLSMRTSLTNCWYCFAPTCSMVQTEPPTSFQVKIFDGAAVVHSLPTSNAATFGDYGDNVFLPWTKQQLQDCDRIDIVWDTYKADSIKEATREKRGKGIR